MNMTLFAPPAHALPPAPAGEALRLAGDALETIVARPPAPVPASLLPSVPRERMRAGRVVSTSGSHVIILLAPDPHTLAMVQMGGLVSARTPDATVYGLIEGLSTPMPLPGGKEQELRVAEISIIGEVPDTACPPVFRRGVSRLPTLDSTVHFACSEDTLIVFDLPDRQSVCIGSIHQDPAVPARVSVDDLLCKHFAMLGTTGTGKSCALTLMLKRILERSPNGHILLLDPHGEYGQAFGARAEHLSADNFRLPHWLFSFDELVEIMFGHAKGTIDAEIMCLRELVLAARLAHAGPGADRGVITVDTPVPYMMSDVTRLLDVAIGSLENRSSIPAYQKIRARIAALQNDRRYALLFDTGVVVRDTLADLVGRIFRIPANGRPLAVLDLASIPSEVLNVVVAVICRLAFDFAVWGGQRAPLLLVCEEAHRYAPQDTALGFEPAKRALARIAKEGRKYGISLGVVSQRPSELDATILSQCNTVFAFRMSNERDQEIIQASLSEASSAMFSALPFLGNGEAIAIGEGVPVPMRLRFDTLPDDERPRSTSASFSGRWIVEEGGNEIRLDRFVHALRDRKMPAVSASAGNPVVFDQKPEPRQFQAPLPQIGRERNQQYGQRDQDRERTRDHGLER